MNRIKLFGTFFAFSLLFLGLMPATASAQYGTIIEDIFGNSRNRNDRDRYGSRYVGDAIRRVESRSEDFTRTLDRALDNSRYNERRREDRILDVAEHFEDAAARLEDAYNDGRNMRNSADEARELLRFGNQIDNFIYSQGRDLNSRVQNEWQSLRRDLQTIADAYGYNFGNRNDRRNRNGDYRRDDDYDDDDNYRRDRDNRNRNRNSRFPF